MRNGGVILVCGLLAATAVGCSSGGSGYGLTEIARSGAGRRYATTTPAGQGQLMVVSLAGTFDEMGEQYGTLLATELAAYYQGVVVDVLQGEKQMPAEQLAADGAAAYAGMLDEMKTFMQGVARGAGLTLEQLEVINASMIELTYGCSAVAAWDAHTGGGPLVLGRSWDLPAGILDALQRYLVLTVYNPPAGRAVADVNYLGQLQYFQTAINDAGLWVDLQNGALSSTAVDLALQDPNAALFGFLRSASTLTELDAAFMAGPASGSVIMTVADPSRAYSYFWCTQGVYRFAEADQVGLLATANHFVEYPPAWTVNPLSSDPAKQAYSEQRRDNWLALATSAEFDGQLDDETMKAMLEHTLDDGGGAFPAGSTFQTVYQVVAVPETLRLWVRMPAGFDWEQVELSRLFQAR
jgi:hypothetical protein